MRYKRLDEIAAREAELKTREDAIIESYVTSDSWSQFVLKTTTEFGFNANSKANIYWWFYLLTNHGYTISTEPPLLFLFALMALGVSVAYLLTTGSLFMAFAILITGAMFAIPYFIFCSKLYRLKCKIEKKIEQLDEQENLSCQVSSSPYATYHAFIHSC